MPPHTYEERVGAATRATGMLASELLDDLDPALGGFGWWHGYMDAPRIALLSEYLLAAVNGVAHSLVDASLQAEVYSERSTADHFWLQAAWKSVVESVRHPSHEDFFKAQVRGPRERRRSRETTLAAEHCFYHLSQVMDRLAAAVIGVAALHLDVVAADWADISRAIKRAKSGGVRPLDDLETDGRAAQELVLDVIDQVVTAGADDWLPWMLQLRNVNAHRAPKMAWMLMTADRRGSARIVTPFYRQPDWPEVEAMVQAPTPANEPSGILLLEDPLDLMRGFIQQTATVTETVVQALLQLWQRRRSEPTLLVQPGSQWKAVMERPHLQFSGFGSPPLRIVGENVYVHPDNGKRLKASKVMDADRSFWRTN